MKWSCDGCDVVTDAEPPYAVGDSEPCALCVDGTARVMNMNDYTNNFGSVIEHLRAGGKASRLGWNGKGMHIALFEPGGASLMQRPYIYMCPVGGELVPWVASQSDMLAEDWALTG